MHGRDGDSEVAGDGRRPLASDGGRDPLETPGEASTTDDGSDGSPVGDGGSSDDTGGPLGGGGDLLTRRRALFAGGGLALVGLGVGAAHVLRPAEAAAPDVPEEDLRDDGWVLLEELQEPVLQDSAGPVQIEAIASTVQWENQGLVGEIKNTDVEVTFAGETRTERLGDYAGEQFDASMGVFAATKIDVTPHVDELPAGIGRAEVMSQVEAEATAQFEQQLQEAGLENVRQVEPTVAFEHESGVSTSFYEYRGEFSFDATSVEVEGVTLVIPGGRIEIAGYLAVWHDGQHIVIAAGAHPNENYTDTVTDDVAGGEVTVSIDLGLRPSELREEVLGYMARVS